MNPRRWTILIVPHDSAPPRQYEVGERAVRVVAGTLGAAALLVLAATMLIFSPWSTPGARLASRENLRLERELDRMDAAFVQLGDSLAVLADRETRFREIAGLPRSKDTVHLSSASMGSVPSAGATGTATGIVAATERPRPFAAYFANRSDRPDASQMLRQAGALSSAFASVSDSMAAKVERLRNVPNLLPTNGWLSGAFSRARLHPILNRTRPHEGIDVSAPKGSPIIAPAGGIVSRVTVQSGYGNMVEIDHGNGIRTLYAHCSRIIVRAGQQVERGQLIATVGSTGLAAGAHLHYEVVVNGKNVDPAKYVLPGGPSQLQRGND